MAIKTEVTVKTSTEFSFFNSVSHTESSSITRSGAEEIQSVMAMEPRSQMSAKLRVLLPSIGHFASLYAQIGYCVLVLS